MSNQAFYEYLLVYPVTAIRESSVFTTWYKFRDLYAAFQSVSFADCDPDTEELFGQVKFTGIKLFISTYEGVVQNNLALDYDLGANNYWINVTDEALKLHYNYTGGVGFNQSLGHGNSSDLTVHSVNTTHHLYYASSTTPAISR